MNMEHHLDYTIKYINVAVSNNQIVETKKKQDIAPNFTYSCSKIALKVCMDKQRFEFNCRTLWLVFKILRYTFLTLHLPLTVMY